MKTFFKFLGLSLCFSFTGCIEFENQQIIYHHDEDEDKPEDIGLNVPLLYTGSACGPGLYGECGDE